MNILEILRKELEGKKIILEKYMFRMGKKSDPIPRFFIPGMSVSERAKNDTRFSFRGIVKADIIQVSGDSDPYEGDSIYIRISHEGNEEEIGITILDQIEVK